MVFYLNLQGDELAGQYWSSICTVKVGIRYGDEIEISLLLMKCNAARMMPEVYAVNSACEALHLGIQGRK